MLLAGAAGCSDDDGPPDAVAGSPQAVAAALAVHHDAEVSAVAPLFRDAEDVRAGDLAVEVALARPGDDARVRVVVTEGPPFGEEDVDALCAGAHACDERDGAQVVLEGGQPEEDPGVVYAWAVREDVTVWAWASGPFVDDEDPSQEVEELVDAMVAVVTDPAVGFRTSAAYAQAGERICASGDWLRWYGDGNGAPRPQDFRDWCG